MKSTLLLCYLAIFTAATRYPNDIPNIPIINTTAPALDILSGAKNPTLPAEITALPPRMIHCVGGYARSDQNDTAAPILVSRRYPNYPNWDIVGCTHLRM